MKHISRRVKLERIRLEVFIENGKQRCIVWRSRPLDWIARAMQCKGRSSTSLVFGARQEKGSGHARLVQAHVIYSYE